MISAISIFILALVGKLAVDLRLYFRGSRNRHSWGPAVVLVMLTACSWIAGWLSAPMWLFGWWILFNGFYAILIGQGWFYVGETAWLDRMERRYRWITPVKYLLFALSIITYAYYR